MKPIANFFRLFVMGMLATIILGACIYLSGNDDETVFVTMFFGVVYAFATAIIDTVFNIIARKI